MTTATKPSDYVEIAKWHERTSSRYYYIEHVQRRAFAEKAPLNAIFYSDTENRWITTDDTAESQAEALRRRKIEAAGPDLLAALEKIVAINGCTGGPQKLVDEFKHIARTAIAKATA